MTFMLAFIEFASTSARIISRGSSVIRPFGTEAQVDTAFDHEAIFLVITEELTVGEDIARESVHSNNIEHCPFQILLPVRTFDHLYIKAPCLDSY